MNFPPHMYNPYILIDLYEEYIKYSNKYSNFRETFPTFDIFIKAHKKHKPNSVIYLHHVRTEARKYHKLYN